MDGDEEANKASRGQGSAAGAALQPVATDNEATNCSETMSTNEEDFFPEVEPEPQPGAGGQPAPLPVPPPGLVAPLPGHAGAPLPLPVPARAGTPHRLYAGQQAWRPAAGLEERAASVEQTGANLAAYLGRQQQVATGDETETATLSLASLAFQAPPSYGTATGSSTRHAGGSGGGPPAQPLAHAQAPVATLDAGQLAQLDGLRPGANCSSGAYLWPDYPAGGRPPSYASQQSAGRSSLPARGPGHLFEGEQPAWAGQVRAPSKLPCYLSSSGSAARVRLAESGAARPADEPMAHQMNSGPGDNDRRAWRPQPQQSHYHQMAPAMLGAPINHVISARGSMRWRQQQQEPQAPAANQRYGATLAGPPSAVAGLAGRRPQVGQPVWPPEARCGSPLRIVRSISDTMQAAAVQEPGGEHLSQAAGRSNENVSAACEARNSRRHDRQPLSKRRRRLRSTSGRSVSPAQVANRATASETMAGHGRRDSPATMEPPPSSNNGAMAGQQQPGQAISAQCWLIDSSDDQQQRQRAGAPDGRRPRGRPARSGAANGSPRPEQGGAHLTVAMMRQSQHQEQLLQARHQQRPLWPPQPSELSANLRANSLKMERILNRKEQQHLAESERAAAKGQVRSLPRGRHGQRHHRHHHQHHQHHRRPSRPASCESSLSARSRSSSDSAHETPAGAGPAGLPATRPRPNRSSVGQQAGSLVRLSALLSLIGNLVRPRRQASSRCLRLANSSSNLNADLELRHRATGAKSASSISGSLSGPLSAAAAASGAHSLGAATASSQVAPYTAASLAISSSSSTSAYATGSSHLSSSGLSTGGGPLSTGRRPSTGPSIQRLFGLSHKVAQSRPFVHSASAHSHAPTGACGAGKSSSSQKVLLSSVSAPPSGHALVLLARQPAHSAAPAPASSHGYEYCDQELELEPVISETRFNGELSKNSGGNLCLPPGGAALGGPGKTAHSNVGSPHLERLKWRRSSAASESEASNGSSSGSSGSSSQGPASASVSSLNDRLNQRPHLAHHLATSDDRELISAGSSEPANNEMTHGTGANMAPGAPGTRGPPVACLPALQTGTARRRWWWISLKQWLLFKRPCAKLANGSSSDSECGLGAARHHYRPASEQIGEAAGARYRSLRQPASHQHRRTAGAGGAGSSGGNGSTLDNVISLAKADPVFRWRLIASIIVSIVLLGLICLLLGLIWSSSSLNSTATNYRHRLNNLLIDDSDYDLSWLWPGHTAAQAAQAQVTPPLGTGEPSPVPVPVPVYVPVPSPGAQQRLDSQQQQQQAFAGSPKSASEQAQEASLRAHLMMIDRSERLSQFQQTIAHLTNIQLANDNFIDITQLAKRLAPERPPSNQQAGDQWADGPSAAINETTGLPGEPGQVYLAESSANNGTRRGTKWRPSNQAKLSPFRVQLNEADHDLVSLSLLSNLHWTLVKWRHQSQQSVASFLSFANPMASSPLSLGAPGTQTLRNLLSMLMLAESMQTLNASAHLRGPAGNSGGLLQQGLNNLHQFARLNHLLRSISYHLISCSYLQEQSGNFQHLSTTRSLFHTLKGKFCMRLISRYRRMMTTLSRLNHGHMSKLDDPFEAAASIAPLNNWNTNGPRRREPSRTLLGFLLDRLALLEAQILAESTLASEDLDQLGPEEAGVGGSSGALIEQLVRQDGLLSILAEEDSNKWQPRSSLYELARTVIGEGPVKLNLNLPDRTNSLLSAFRLGSGSSRFWDYPQTGMDANPESWRHWLNQDLLYPWSSYKLPEFVRPTSYDIFLHPNLTTRLVMGIVKIEFQIKRPTRYIVINCDQLNLAEVSLWLRLAPVYHRVQGADIDGGSNVNAQQQQQISAEQQLKQIPIRRVLTNAKFEQIYIELENQIEPVNEHGQKSSLLSNGAKSAPSSYQADEPALNFGELPVGRTPDELIRGQLESQFVLSITFNKTNLMPNELLGKSQSFPGENYYSGTPPMAQTTSGAGLEFVQYGDYFSQATEAEVKTILYTQFEPTNARRVFPCFDEPQFKARFQLNLVHEHQHQVLFNGPKRERVPYTSDGSLQMSVFEGTPVPLSSYLVSFVVCDAQNMKSITTRVAELAEQPSGRNGSTGSRSSQILAQISPILDGRSGQQNEKQAQVKMPTTSQQQAQEEPKHIQVQVLAQFEHLGQAEYASQLVPQLLAFYQAHLKMAYPLDKLDLIAIPKAIVGAHHDGEMKVQNQQRSKGAPGLSSRLFSGFQTIDTMENLGLIWFKAPFLLVDTNLIDQNLIEQISSIISHQIAHQYFGNIVSIRRWQDLWLYEALCQYLEALALARVQVDWKLEEQFAVASIQETLTMEQFETLPGTRGLAQTLLAAGPDAPGGQQLDLLAGQQPADGANSEFSASEPDGNFIVNQVEPAAASQEAIYLDAGQDMLDSERARELQRLNNQFDSIDLKRQSALLHMLLFNLLPGQESQARLLRRCLFTYRSTTMSVRQFWTQFGQQMAQEASPDRMSLDVSKLVGLTAASGERPLAFAPTEFGQDSEPGGFAGYAQVAPPVGNSSEQVYSGERVVFVRPSLTQGASDTAPAPVHHQHEPEEQDERAADMHRVQIEMRTGRLVDNLDLVAEAWLSRAGYPLITARSTYRDRINLRQERFSFAWWNGPILPDEHNEQVGPSEQALASGGHQEATAAHGFRWKGNQLSAVEPAQQAGEETGQQQALKEQQVLDEEDVWPVPLMFVSRFNPKQARFVWMDRREIELPLNGALESSPPGGAVDPSSESLSRPGLIHHANNWYKLNVNQSTLIRVNYDERNWEALTELLVKSHYSNHLLSPLDRANLLDDALTLMRCGKLSLGIAMNLTLYLEVGERDFQPWTSVLRHLDQMQTLLNQNPLWHRYVLKLMGPISSVIGWKDDGPHLMRKLRRNLFSVALQYGDERILNKAKQEFKSWLKSGRFIVPNLQELVYVAGVRYGDQQEWFHCWQMYQQLVSLAGSATDVGASGNNNNDSSSDMIGQSAQGFRSHHWRQQQQGQHTVRASGLPLPSVVSVGSAGEFNEAQAENEKRQLLTALASTHNTWLLEQFLNYSLDSTKIQSHHLKHVMQTLGRNPVARLYLWRFVRLNWATLVEKFKQDELNEFSPNSININSNQILETMILESTKHFATKLDYEEVKVFFDGKRKQQPETGTRWSASVERAIKQSLQVIRSNIYWRDYIEPKLTKWLSHYATI